jgi:hypothetical protein
MSTEEARRIVAEQGLLRGEQMSERIEAFGRWILQEHGELPPFEVSQEELRTQFFTEQEQASLVVWAMMIESPPPQMQ